MDEEAASRRLLTSAVVHAREYSLRLALLRLRAATTAGVRIPQWRLGELYRKQRLRRLSAGLLKFSQNTPKHRMQFAAEYYSNRLRSVVLGAWTCWHRDEAEREAEEEERALTARRARQSGRGMQGLNNNSLRRRRGKEQVRLAALFSVLVLCTRGLLGLIKWRRHRRLESQRRPVVDASLHALQRCHSVWVTRMRRRLTLGSLSRRRPQTRAAAHDALLALRAHALRSRPCPTASVADLAHLRAVRRMLGKALTAWVNCTMRRYTSRKSFRSLAGPHWTARLLARGLASLRRLRVEGLIAHEATQVASLLRARRPVAKRGALGRIARYLDGSAAQARALHQARLHAFEGCRRRCLLNWVRRLKARLLAGLSLQRAHAHAVFSWSFRRCSAMLSRWVQLRFRRRVIESRRLALAKWGFARKRLAATMQALASHCTLQRARASVLLLGEFHESQRRSRAALTALSTRGLASHEQMRLLVSATAFWKLWRCDAGLLRWRSLVQRRRQRRLDWAAAQQEYGQGMERLGLQLWLREAGRSMSVAAASGIGSKGGGEERRRQLAAQVWRQWRQVVLRNRVRRGLEATWPADRQPPCLAASAPSPSAGAAAAAAAAAAVSEGEGISLSRAPPRRLLPDFLPAEALRGLPRFARTLPSFDSALDLGQPQAELEQSWAPRQGGDGEEESPPRYVKPMAAFASPLSVAGPRALIDESPQATPSLQQPALVSTTSTISRKKERQELAAEILSFVQEVSRSLL